MEIELPNDAVRFIEGLVASGAYPSLDEAVTDGVRLLMIRQQLRAEIQQGIDELDAGQGVEGDSVFAELRWRSRNLRCCESSPATVISGRSELRRAVRSRPRKSTP